MNNELIQTQDGSHSLLSRKYGVSYHSKYGAIQESQHVFIEAGLQAKMLRKSGPIRVLEFGFGTGLNAYLSFIVSEKHQRAISYVGVEAYPIDITTAQGLNYPELLEQAQAPFLELHKSKWNQVHQIGDYFSFEKHELSFEDIHFTSQFDVVFFDAFAPSSQPELWESEILAKAYDALAPEGLFVTYCAKGVVKRSLKALGFQVEALPGPPGKREMTRGLK